jgi:hypothetical protein
MTELRRKMLEELQLRNYSPHTQRAYIRCVADFAQHFNTAPDRLGPEHVHEYQLFLVQRKKLSWSPFTQAVCALRFFYNDVLHRNWMIEYIPYPRHEQKLPVVLSPAEVAALFQSTPNLKHRAILTTMYAAGLRVSELINLQVTDIDSQRQVISSNLCPSGKGPQRSPGDALTEVAGDTANLLEALSTQDLALPRTESGASNYTKNCLAHLPSGACSRTSGQTDIASHLAALLRHPSAGRSDRSAPHPNSAGTSQPKDDGQVPARFQPGGSCYRQPAGSIGLSG